MNKHFFAFLFAACSLPLYVSGQSDGWISKGEKSGVKVYIKMQGQYYDVKLVTSIKTSLSAFCHLMSDVENYKEWGYKISDSRLINQKDEYNMQYYSRLDFPWPLNDRDVTLANSMAQEPNGVVTFRSKAVTGLEPELKDVVRMDDVETTWKIWPPKNGWCYVEYTIHSNPKGNLPEMLVNAAIDVGPRETVAAIKRELQKPKYQTVRLAHIRE